MKDVFYVKSKDLKEIYMNPFEIAKIISYCDRCLRSYDKYFLMQLAEDMFCTRFKFTDKYGDPIFMDSDGEIYVDLEHFKTKYI